MLDQPTRQACMQTSAHVSGFAALKKTLETTVTMRCQMRSMGVTITEPAMNHPDNKRASLNAASTEQKGNCSCTSQSFPPQHPGQMKPCCHMHQQFNTCLKQHSFDKCLRTSESQQASRATSGCTTLPVENWMKPCLHRASVAGMEKASRGQPNG